MTSPRRQPLAVTLRPARPADAPLLAAWRRESSVRRHQPLAEMSAAQLRAEIAAHDPEDLYRGSGEKFQWVILAGGEPAGWITLVVSNWTHGLAEIGYALSTSFQRRGLMPAALEQLLADLFARTEVERVEARCAVGNLASRKVLERVGFRREGLLRAYFVLAGERVDNWLYAILRDDFLPRPGERGLDSGGG